MTIGNPETRKIRLPSGLVCDVLTKGQGAPLVFLHPAHGRAWSAFLDRMSEQFTVHAPLTPGADEPDELMAFDGFGDLSMFYDDLLRALKIDTAIVVGHAFGGMVAAELAAHYPERVSALILIDALGLWIDETPVADIYTTHPSKLPALLFTDPEGPVATSILYEPTPEVRLNNQLALGAATHFCWPIPDRDLKRRLYRVSAPTLLVWGASDRVVPPIYADAFAAHIRGAQTVLVKGASHFPHLEKTDDVLRAINNFVRAPATETTSA
jgi:pimeloyl-ACP methyl ester carboxylesterase